MQQLAKKSPGRIPPVPGNPMLASQPSLKATLPSKQGVQMPSSKTTKAFGQMDKGMSGLNSKGTQSQKQLHAVKVQPALHPQLSKMPMASLSQLTNSHLP